MTLQANSIEDLKNSENVTKMTNESMTIVQKKNISPSIDIFKHITENLISYQVDFSNSDSKNKQIDFQINNIGKLGHLCKLYTQFRGDLIVNLTVFSEQSTIIGISTHCKEGLEEWLPNDSNNEGLDKAQIIWDPSMEPGTKSIVLRFHSRQKTGMLEDGFGCLNIYKMDNNVPIRGFYTVQAMQNFELIDCSRLNLNN